MNVKINMLSGKKTDRKESILYLYNILEIVNPCLVTIADWWFSEDKDKGERRKRLTRTGHFRGESYVHYLDYGDDFIVEYMYQNV